MSEKLDLIKACVNTHLRYEFASLFQFKPQLLSEVAKGEIYWTSLENSRLLRSALLSLISSLPQINHMLLLLLLPLVKLETPGNKAVHITVYTPRPPLSAWHSLPPRKRCRSLYLALSSGSSGSMDSAKGEQRSAEQAASLFGASEMESQGRQADRGKKRNNCKIITGVRFNSPLPDRAALLYTDVVLFTFTFLLKMFFKKCKLTQVGGSWAIIKNWSNIPVKVYIYSESDLIKSPKCHYYRLYLYKALKCNCRSFICL